MKLNASALHSVLLCGIVLLSLSPACEKKRPSVNQQTPEQQTAMIPTPDSPPSSAQAPQPQTPSSTPTLTTPSPTPTFSPASPTPKPSISPPPPPPPPSPEVTYILDDSSAATKIVNEAIEAAVKEVVWPFKGQARDELKKTNLPPPQRITISYTSTEVSITTDRTGTIKTPVDGTSVSRIILGEKLDVSTKRSDGNLERIFKRKDGERVNTYSFGATGKTMTMRVHATGKRLGISVKLDYVLRYKRIS